MDRRIEALPVTIAGETRLVDFYVSDASDWRYSVEHVGAFQKRPGTKVWHQRLDMVRRPDGSWHVKTSTTLLNRSGYRLIGWASNHDKRLSMHTTSITPYVAR